MHATRGRWSEFCWYSLFGPYLINLYCFIVLRWKKKLKKIRNDASIHFHNLIHLKSTPSVWWSHCFCSLVLSPRVLLIDCVTIGALLLSCALFSHLTFHNLHPTLFYPPELLTLFFSSKISYEIVLFFFFYFLSYFINK